MSVFAPVTEAGTTNELGLTVLAVTSILLAVMGSMDVSAPVTIEGLWRHCMVRMVPAALVGLGATGASLC